MPAAPFVQRHAGRSRRAVFGYGGVGRVRRRHRQYRCVRHGKLEADGRKLQDILAITQGQTAPHGDIVGMMDRSDVRLRDLSEGKAPISLVLPALRIGTHFGWLRLVIEQTLAAMERNPLPCRHSQVWSAREEVPALGHARSIETAAG